MKLKDFFVSTLIISAVCYLCIDFDKVSLCVQNTLILCSTNLIPALFPFFVLSEILMSITDYSKMPHFIKKTYGKFFRMPISTISVFITGLISGYPVGASLTYDMYKRGDISKPCAEKLLGYTNNPGPMFVISVVGSGMFGNMENGFVLYIIHIISVLVTVMISEGNFTNNAESFFVHKKYISIPQIIEENFMKTIKICGFVTIFSILNCALSEILGLKYGGLISCITEITSGISQVSQLFPEKISMPVTSFALAFSGICVCLQVCSVTRYELCITKYIKTKLLNGIVAAVLCSLYMKYVRTEFKNIQMLDSNIIIYILIVFTYIVIGIYFITRLTNKAKK